MAKNTQQQLVPAGSQDEDASTAQFAALVGSVMSGLKPMAEQQAQVQLAQIEAARERDERAFRFARAALLTGAGILLVIVTLLAAATAFLFSVGSEQTALHVIWFGVGALGGAGAMRAMPPRQ